MTRFNKNDSEKHILHCYYRSCLGIQYRSVKSVEKADKNDSEKEKLHGYSLTIHMFLLRIESNITECYENGSDNDNRN